jgi:hypothetical protein
MRKWTLPFAIALLVLGSAAPEMVRAESIKKATRKDVTMLLNAASGMNSAFEASLIGETRGRVFVEYVTGVHLGSSLSNKARRVVYWLPRSEIADEQLAQFKAYKEKFLFVDRKPGN